MTTRKALLFILVASTAMLAVGIGLRVADTVQALPPAKEAEASGVSIPYPGRLADREGVPVPAGDYDFSFALYEAETGGEPLWSEVQDGVRVEDGAFMASLGSAVPIPAEVVNGDDRWLVVGVRGSGDDGFVALHPRQHLTTVAPAAPASSADSAACPHDHFGEEWVGTHQWHGLRVENAGGVTGIEGQGDFGVKGYGGDGLEDVGLYGYARYGYGLKASSDFGYGVYATCSACPAVYASGGVGVVGIGEVGVSALGTEGTKDYPALSADNTNTTNGMAAYLHNSSDYHTTHIHNEGRGGVLFLQNNGDATGRGGDFVTAVNSVNDTKLRVGGDGSVYNDTGVYTQPADFAEMLPAREGLQPGEVLVIGADGKLARSSQAYQASVAGVYSTKPGFVGGYPTDGAVAGTIPLSIVGVVPVKVSAENGPILPGDPLVASSTPGHAMNGGSNAPQGTVIGKALEKLDVGTGIIKMLATLQ